MKTEYRRAVGQVTMIATCAKCGMSEAEVFDFGEKPEPNDPDYVADRDNFCLNDEEGNEYLGGRESTERWEQERKEQIEREKLKPILDEIAKLRRLRIAEVENLLATALGNEGFAKFELGKPNVAIDVRVGFSVQDSKPGRSEHDSTKELGNLIIHSLDGTNWRLMTDGIEYRLGVLSGYIRGLESEKDLIELVRVRLKRRKGAGAE
jgi:hypothetical protein